MKEHVHEHTQFTLPGEKAVVIDPNFSNVLKNIRDQIGSLNANIQNYSDATSKQSMVTVALTVALVLLAFAQVAVAYLNYINEQFVIYERKQCFQSVLQTSDIDLNYKSCLRDHGLSD